MSDEVVPFISYAKEDVRAVEKLVSDLHWLGAKPWVDFEKLKGGQDWKREIKQALEESSHILVVISHNSVNKRGFFQREVRQALDLLLDFPPGAVFLIPVRLDDTVPLHDEIKNLQWIDLFNIKQSPLKHLSVALGLKPPALQYLTVNTYYHLDYPTKDLTAVRHVQKLLPFRADIQKLTIRGIAGSGDVAAVNSDLGLATLEREGGVTSANVLFSSPLKPGVVNTHTVSYEGIGCFREQQETVAQNISHVLHSSAIEVAFPANNPPKSWNAVLITDDGAAEIPGVEFYKDTCILAVTVAFPPLGSRIVLSWEW